ncbi:MAG: DUF1464 domain-containing protein [Promethearchaeota archaeon]|nr:MAG: DUF1464 domain-containing protein [Candidatus Lokiarchaeota archaeon]
MMPRVVGIDPGTDSWGIVGLQDDQIILDTSIPTKRVIEKPSLIIDVLNSLKEIDLIVAPSGHGLPNTPIQALSEHDLFLLTIKKKISEKITGLGEIARLLKDEGFKGYFIPSVKLLSTVPPHRKINKIDMGTADKVCSAALGIYDQSNEFKIEYSDTSFILVEIGTGFTAIIGIQNGKIVDGIGGSLGCPGFLACGAIDGELAYLFDNIYKRTVYSGGAAYVAGYNNLSPEEFIILAKTDEKFKMAKNFLIEGILKDINAMTVSVKHPKEILLSGRLSKIDTLCQELNTQLKAIAPVRRIKGLSNVHIAKEAAQGAAIIANGLAGGKFKALIENMNLLDAKGTVLDYIYFKEIEKYK